MRRLFAWIGGAAGGLAAYRLLRRRTAVSPEVVPEAPAEPDGRAEELRAKLAEKKAPEPVVEEPSAEPVAEEAPAEPVVEEAPAEPENARSETPDERRRRVHEEGRSTLDEMQSEQPGAGREACPATTVKTRTVKGLGAILVDSRGDTLYKVVRTQLTTSGGSGSGY